MDLPSILHVMAIIPMFFWLERSNVSGYSIAPFRHTASDDSVLQKKPKSMVTLIYLAVSTRYSIDDLILREMDSVAILRHGSHGVRPESLHLLCQCSNER